MPQGLQKRKTTCFFWVRVPVHGPMFLEQPWVKLIRTGGQSGQEACSRCSSGLAVAFFFLGFSPGFFAESGIRGISWGEDGLVLLWDLQKGNLQQQLLGHQEARLVGGLQAVRPKFPLPLGVVDRYFANERKGKRGTNKNFPLQWLKGVVGMRHC